MEQATTELYRHCEPLRNAVGTIGALPRFDFIKDSSGRQFWSSTWGLHNFNTEWSVFIAELDAQLGQQGLAPTTQNDRVVLQFILDNSGTGYVNQHKFSEFLKSFGPVSDCLTNIRNIFCQPWFYGFLSKKEAEHLLLAGPPGSFLVRFSKSKPGNFALAFSDLHSSCYHILVVSDMPRGFSVLEQETRTHRTFSSLTEVIQQYSWALKQPLQITLPYEVWFQGDLSGEEAKDLLIDQPVGTFLVRFSGTQVRSFAATYVDTDSTVKHSLISYQTDPPGYRLPPDTIVLPTLAGVISHYKVVLKTPLPNPLSKLRSIVQLWKEEQGTGVKSVEFKPQSPTARTSNATSPRLSPIVSPKRSETPPTTPEIAKRTVGDTNSNTTMNFPKVSLNRTASRDIVPSADRAEEIVERIFDLSIPIPTPDVPFGPEVDIVVARLFGELSHDILKQVW